MTNYQTSYGLIEGITSYELHDNGLLKCCTTNQENILDHPLSPLTPQYSATALGQRQKKTRNAITFYNNGTIKSVSLEDQIPIKTPIGTIDAELLTFYENGQLKRIFPLNGRIDGFWSEEDEGELCRPYPIPTSFGTYRIRIIGLYFYESGALKSVTLWPGEKISMQTPRKNLTVHIGFSLYESGRIKSVEPAQSVTVPTLIGEIAAYDKDALGINADHNSLKFSESGRIVALTSTQSGIRVTKDDSDYNESLEPLIIDSYTDDDDKTLLPLHIKFRGDQVIIEDNFAHIYEIYNHHFEVFNSINYMRLGCLSCSDCSGCP